MMKKLTLALFLTLAITQAFAASEKMKASVNLGWVFYAYNIGDALAVKEFGPQNNIDITLVPAGEGIDPIKMVIAGQQTFGYAGATDALKAINQGADLVILGTIMPQDPTVFLSRAERNIKTPQDWKGKRVGRLPGGSTEYPYQALLKKSNLTDADFKEMTIPFDMGTFIADKYDVRPAFIFDEPISLDDHNIKYTIINPVDFGVRLIGPVIVTKRETIEKQPAMVQAYISSLASGVKAAIADQKHGMDALMSFDPGLDRAHEEKSLAKGIQYYTDPQTKRVLYTSPTHFADMQKTLLAIGILDKPVDLDKHLNLSFINKWQASQPKAK